VKEYTQKETLLALVEELISLTKKLTASAEAEDAGALAALVSQRETAITNLQRFTDEIRSRCALPDEEVKSAFAALMKHSQRMQEALERKRKSALATLTSLQQRRFYSI